jgi:taurine dioxygenase
MGSLKVRRCGYALGAEITGVDASKPLDDATIAAIRQAWLDHIMVYLPGQNLGPQGFRDFCAQFGELDLENIKTLPHHPDFPDVVVRANKPVTVDENPAVRASGAANHWHTDFSSTDRPSTITFLLGKELPSVGGDTMFANLYTAYETLSPAMQRTIDPLFAVHDVRVGRANKSPKPPVVHPFVRVHPETGRKALYVADRVRNFVGMTEEESKPLVAFLRSHATRYEFVYRHRWTVNDVVLWDNRCSLHYAVQDYDPEMRMLLRCSLASPKTGRLLLAENEEARPVELAT